MILSKFSARFRTRRGIVTILVTVCLIVLVGIAAISLDGGLLQDNKRRVQAAADAAALAAGTALFDNFKQISSGTPDPGGKAAAAALDVANRNGFPNDSIKATVTVNIPPKSGPFTGKANYAEVIISYYQQRYFSTIWGSEKLTVQGRAVAIGFWGGTGNGVIVLDPSAKSALDASGTGSVTVTGGAAMVVNSNDAEAARSTGGGNQTATNYWITGGYTGTLNGNIETGTPPIPDPLAYLPPPTKPAAGTMTTVNVKSTKVYVLTPGSYSSLPNLGNGDSMILKQGGIYYIDGGGLTATGGSAITMDPLTSGGVMIYNAPNGTQSNQSINLSGGKVNLSPLTSGPYAGIVLWQDRTSPVAMSIQGQGDMNIKGTFYAANALLSVSGQGTNTIGSQYISRTLSLSGGGAVNIDYTDDGTARKRDIRLAE